MNARTNEHEQISDLLPLYVSGALDSSQRKDVESHLRGCEACQADLAVWKMVSGEITAVDQTVTAPRDLAERALDVVENTAPAAQQAWALPKNLRHVLVLLRSQMPLVHREIWPASALVIGLGYIGALIAAQSVFVYALAPLVAAACVSLIYGPENDPAFELSLSTPTSPRQIMLARLVLVFGYNLALVLAATIGLLPILGSQPLLGALAVDWLAPMAFLSAAALVLSLWFGAPNAISVTYIAWLMHLLDGLMRSPQAPLELSPVLMQMTAAYQSFWQASGLLLLLAGVLFALSIWLAGHKDQMTTRIA